MSRKSEEKKPEDKPATVSKSEGKKTPLAWAEALGFRKKHGRGPEARHMLSAEYVTANVYYGWEAQVHHWGADSLTLSESDFKAAMVAASKFPTVPLHEPAISQVFKDSGRYTGFKPLKAHKD